MEDPRSPAAVRPPVELPGGVRDTLFECLVARRFDDLNAALAALPGSLSRVRVDMVDNARAAEAAPVWRVEADGSSRFRFHQKTWSQHPGEIVGRWIATLPLIAAALDARPVGSCVLNLGDEGHRPGLAFDGLGDRFTLIPDDRFLMTRGYRDLAHLFAARALPWRERRPVAFWRGSTTGLETDPGHNPRVRLCRAAQAMGPIADIGFSSATAEFAGAEPALRAEGLFRDFVLNTRFDEYQVHIDIDGNSSPWTGFAKLHTGSPVVKVMSAAGYRQWYYDRLVPWQNFVPVRPDLSDLAANVATLLADPDLAMRIGAAGKALAAELSFEREVARAVPTIVAALR